MPHIFLSRFLYLLDKPTELRLNTFAVLILALSFVFSTNLYSAEEVPEQAVEEEEEKEPVMYFRITPNILTFYQSTGRKIGYIVVQVQVVVRGQDNYDLVELHLPLIQDALTDFFNRQDKSIVSDLAQRESLRQQATVRVAEVIKEEVGTDVVENVLFTQYIFQ